MSNHMRTTCVAIPLALALLVTAAVAHPRHSAGRRNYDSKKLGAINPSNIAIVDTDLLESMSGQGAADQISLSAAHRVATGEGIVVAVLDGGFNLDHDELSGSLSKYAYDAIDRDSQRWLPDASFRWRQQRAGRTLD